MTSRFTLLFAVAGIATLAGCSAPAEGGNTPDPPMPTAPPPGSGGSSNLGTGGTDPVGVAQGGTTNTAQGGTANTAQGGTAPIAQGGTGGAPAEGALPTQLALTPTAGWVANTTNDVGIQGSFHTISDAAAGGVTTIAPENFMAVTAAPVCVSGVASQVVNGDDAMPAYATYWGGGIGFNLADAGENMNMPQPWDRGRVVGFSYNLTGPDIPAGLRFQMIVVGNTGDGFCTVAGTAGPHTTLISGTPADAVAQACWGAPGPAIPATAQLEAIQWQVATVVDGPTTFDFCVENLTAVVQ